MSEETPNKTRNILTKYEKVQLIGTRAEQLRRGAIPTIKIDTEKEFDPRAIAYEELMQRKIPLGIVRTLPNGKTETWKIDDMIIL